MTRRSARRHASTVHLTIEERDILLAHSDPDSGIADLVHGARVIGLLVSLELTEEELITFLDAFEATANSAQNEIAMERLGYAFARINAGLTGDTDPGAHLLRPALSRLDMSAKQGQYLAFIYLYIRLHRRAPTESELQEYFRSTPPAVHDMLKTLQRKQFISRSAGRARSTRVLLAPHELPELE
jgi:DNA-binding MarR family transcriptional regulator